MGQKPTNREYEDVIDSVKPMRSARGPDSPGDDAPPALPPRFNTMSSFPGSASNASSRNVTRRGTATNLEAAFIPAPFDADPTPTYEQTVSSQGTSFQGVADTGVYEKKGAVPQGSLSYAALPAAGASSSAGAASALGTAPAVGAVALEIEAGVGTSKDLVLRRLQAYKHLTKTYSLFVAEHAQCIRNYTKSASKTSQALAISLDDQNLFVALGRSGVADVMDAARLSFRDYFQKQESVTQTLLNNIVQEFQVQRREAKAFMSRYEKSVRAPYASMKQSLTDFQEKKQALQKFLAIDVVEPKHDPYLLYLVAHRSLEKYGIAYTSFQTVVDAEIAKLQLFERQFLEKVHSNLASFLSWVSSSTPGFAPFATRVQTLLAQFSAATEWDNFATAFQGAFELMHGASRHHAVKENFEAEYSGRVLPIKSGYLEREKGFSITRRFASNYVVVTRARFVHFFSSPDALPTASTDFSLFLPNYAVTDVVGDKFQLQNRGGSGKTTVALRNGNPDELAGWQAELAGLLR